MSRPRVLIPLAAGFEEIEAVTIIDVLRRAGLEAVVAGLEPGPVTGAHGIPVTPDTTLDAVSSSDLDMVVLPGGMPGAQHLHDDQALQALLREMKAKGKWTAAICAAPMALVPSGVTEGRTVTSYPGFADRVPAGAYVEDRVVVDGRVITSRGPGTALEFALTLVSKLAGDEKARELQAAMLVHRPEPVHEV